MTASVMRRTGFTWNYLACRLDVERPDDVRVEARDCDVLVYVNGELAVSVTGSRSPVIVREYE